VPAVWQDWGVWPRRRTLVRALPWALGVLLLVGIAIPNLTSATHCGNGIAARSTLHIVAIAQQQFRDAALIDVDGDGCGEFGSFLELSGAVELRGRDRVLNPPVLSGTFRSLNARGDVSRSGYLFRVYLLAEGGVWVPADPLPDDIATDAAETAFLCYAWPMKYGTSGKSTYVVDQTGTVLHTDDPRYSGVLVPAPGSAAGAGAALVAGIGADGNEWVVGSGER